MNELVGLIEENLNLIVISLLGFSVLLATIEFFYELYKKKIDRWRLGEMWASFSVFIGAQLTEKIGTYIFVAIFVKIAEWIPWEIPVNGWTAFLAILLVDFLYYWEHRLEHEVRILWTYHSIHHSSPIYNYTTALRVSFIDNLVTWVFFLPAILIGFNPYLVLLALTIVLVYQFWIHTELINKMGWMEKIFMTPSLHRVHHGSDDIYLDKNYGAIFSIWDRMFGTYQIELHKPTYGLTTPLNSINPIKVHFQDFINLSKESAGLKNWKLKLKHLIMPPGWVPEESEKISKY